MKDKKPKVTKKAIPDKTVSGKTASNRTSSAKASSRREFKINKEILKITYIFAGLFFLLLGYFVYFQVTEAADVVNNPYNKRQENFEEKVVRGNIMSADGETLAYTDVDNEGNETRVYPYDNVFAHVVGIASYGKYGLELSNNFDLLTSNINGIEIMLNEFNTTKSMGDNVITTLDTKLQKAACNALGNYDGSVVIMEADTGKILSMVSKPDYNPNNISSIWKDITKEGSTDTSLVNRATQGRYTPGSVFKIITTLGYMRTGGDYKGYHFNCKGVVDFNLKDGYKIKCFNNSVHGEENLEDAFANSCNCAYSTIGKDLDKEKFAKIGKELLFNSDLPLTIPYNKSSLDVSKDSTIFDMTQVGIGQGKTTVSPMHMAMISAAVINDGVLMKPYLVDKIETYNGKKVKGFTSQKYKDLLSKNEASILQEYMKATVERGTAQVLNTNAYEVGGKTGTAELDKNGQTHSWFTGYVKTKKQTLAVAVVLEDIPAGSGRATDILKAIMDKYVSN